MASRKTSSKKTTSKKSKKVAKKSAPGKKNSNKIEKKRAFRSLRQRWADRPQRTEVPRLVDNVRRSGGILRKHWKPLGGTVVIYGLLYFLFVRVLTRIDITDLTETINEVFGNGEGSVTTKLITVSTLFGESTNLDNQTGVQYALSSIIFSLAFIWLLRYIWAGRRPRMKEAFYQGMYPLVPFTFILLFVLVQLIPLSIVTFIFQNAFNNSLAIEFYEKVFFVALFAGGALLSGYFVIGSAVAAYAVTVPGVTPTEAHRTAKALLRGRRLLLLRQAVVFIFLSGVVVLGIMLVILWLIPQTAVVSTAIILILLLAWFHMYFYGLYRDLLGD